jgi:stage V sporulation protein R
MSQTYSLDDLQEWDEKICEIGKKHKLDWFDIHYESIDYYEMIGAMAHHGMPSFYSHWSFGKAFERTHQMYNVGQEGLPYELIINSNPSIAYLMRENPFPLQILIMAHCVGHSDFFKNNRMFKNTRPENIIQRFRSAKKRIQSYIEDPTIGIDEVEKVIDACHAIQFQTTKHGLRRRTQDEIRQEKLEQLKAAKAKSDITLLPTISRIESELETVPLEPDYDILGFILENGKIPNWKKDIIDVIREEGHYFWPQIQTKIANEGWASYNHYKICHELELPSELHLPIIKSHNQVIRPHIGAINPYHLGFHLFQQIEKKYGYEECLIAREACHDSSFIRQYLDEELCSELNLFSYSKKKMGVTIDDVADELGWKQVRDDLAKSVGGGSIPVVYITEARRNGDLIICHEHDGRDLDVDHARNVVLHIEKLWGYPVKMLAKVNGELTSID